jgi:hypothetical protein
MEASLELRFRARSVIKISEKFTAYLRQRKIIVPHYRRQMLNGRAGIGFPANGSVKNQVENL